MKYDDLKEYQKKAINELVEATEIALDTFDESKRKITFKSPTGSGKTVMMAKYIEKIVKLNKKHKIAFVWLSPGDGEIHIQSCKKLKNIFEGYPKCNLLDINILKNKSISENEVIVCNWQKLRAKDKETSEWSNILMKDGEYVNFREYMINSTIVNGYKIILIIDETHTNANSDVAKEIQEIINPHITIGMSATPKNTDGVFITVPPEDVSKEGMIKESIIINQKEEMEEYLIDEEEHTSLQILYEGYAKLKQLQTLYQSKNINVNPLCLIQLPNNNKYHSDNDNPEVILTKIEKYLEQKGITYENKKLAIKLSGSKEKSKDENKGREENYDDLLKNNDSDVEFLIFKQSIATGWDCPRAQILVKFREMKSETFKIQLVGRILRTPEAKHYEDPILDNGYIYTNTNDIRLDKDTYGWVKDKDANLNENIVFNPISLYSYKKAYDSTKKPKAKKVLSILKDILKEDLEIGEEYTKKENLEKLKTYGVELDELKIKNYREFNKHVDTKNIDKGNESIITTNTIKQAIENTPEEWEDIFNNRIRSINTRFYYALKKAVEDYFIEILIEDNESINLLYKIIGYEDNFNNVFKLIFNEVVEKYKLYEQESIINIKDEKIDDYNKIFRFKKYTKFSSTTYEEVLFKKYAYDKCYLKKNRPKTEKEFEQYLDSNEDILWWYKNGDFGSEHFCIKCETEDKIKSFYPDYIVKFIDGTIGIYETKSASNQSEVSEGTDSINLKGKNLHDYIERFSTKKEPIVGGIIAIDGKSKFLSTKDNYDIKDYHNWVKVFNKLK